MRITKAIIAIATASFLAGCGESNEDAYQRGYEGGLYDGWYSTCYDIARFSSKIEAVLKREGIC